MIDMISFCIPKKKNTNKNAAQDADKIFKNIMRNSTLHDFFFFIFFITVY